MKKSNSSNNSIASIAKKTICLGVLSLSISVPAVAADNSDYLDILKGLNFGTLTDSIKNIADAVGINTSASSSSSNTLTDTTVSATGPIGNTVTPGTSMPNTGIKTDIYPETSRFNADLPIIQTTHGSDHIRANVLNPHPICNSAEDFRTVIYEITDNWLPVGTVSTYNSTKTSIPLTQTTAKTQTIAISVNGSQTETTTINIGGNASGSADGLSGGGSTGIAYSLAKQIGGQASYELSWNVGQEIGPYDVPAGYTGEATYGFRAVNMSGTQQYCRPNGTWSTPTAYRAFVPIKNEVRVSLYNNYTDSVDTTVPEWDFIAPTPQPAENINIIPPLFPQKYDLKPYMSVSGAKAQGFAGSTALHVKNVGYNDYYGDFPVVSFLVEVKTVDGPRGVDRVITPHWYNGAYVQDLGFNPESSTRSFLVTLSNPITMGDDVTVASFNFNDGDTKLGRIKNSIQISQIGRIEGDDTYYNDTRVNSLFTTVNDFGNPVEGIF